MVLGGGGKVRMRADIRLIGSSFCVLWYFVKTRENKRKQEKARGWLRYDETGRDRWLSWGVVGALRLFCGVCRGKHSVWDDQQTLAGK